MEKCKKCGGIILEINVGTHKNPKWVENKVRGHDDDVFCGYCASTCFFIKGEMYTLEEAIKISKKVTKK